MGIYRDILIELYDSVYKESFFVKLKKFHSENSKYFIFLFYTIIVALILYVFFAYSRNIIGEVITLIALIICLILTLYLKIIEDFNKVKERKKRIEKLLDFKYKLLKYKFITSNDLSSLDVLIKNLKEHAEYQKNKGERRHDVFLKYLSLIAATILGVIFKDLISNERATNEEKMTFSVVIVVVTCIIAYIYFAYYHTIYKNRESIDEKLIKVLSELKMFMNGTKLYLSRDQTKHKNQDIDDSD